MASQIAPGMMSAMDRQGISPAAVAELIVAARHPVALTGAGVSTAAGIPDFRGPGGLYSDERYAGGRVFDIDYFRADPRPFFQFTRDLLATLKDIRPTFTHRLLAWMEQAGLLNAVITQNIDPLHRLAGSSAIVAVHGDYSTCRCLACGKGYTYEQFLERMAAEEVPHCACRERGVLKPDVVFFGEQVASLPVAAGLARRPT